MNDYSILDIPSVYTPPYILDFTEYVKCPVCDMEINVFNKIVDINSFVDCENCEHKIKFNLVKV
jgi:transcription elongation factor Elf1